MDIDSDPVDQNFLMQFNCMGTTDRDDLVKQLVDVIGERMNTTTATFFLEMNNWNLQAAVCSFLDYEAPRKLPSMTLEDGRATHYRMPPDARFTVTWVIKNDGEECWPHGCTLQYVGGDYDCNVRTIPVRVLSPDHSTTIITEFRTPTECGEYHSRWQMMTPYGAYFGDVLWVSFQVVSATDHLDELVLSEELSSRMALADDSNTTAMDDFEIDTNFTPVTAARNPFAVSPIIFNEAIRPNVGDGEDDIS